MANNLDGTGRTFHKAAYSSEELLSSKSRLNKLALMGLAPAQFAFPAGSRLEFRQ